MIFSFLGLFPLVSGKVTNNFKWIASDGAGFTAEETFTGIATVTGCSLIASSIGAIAFNLVEDRCEILSQKLKTFKDWEEKPKESEVTAYLKVDETRTQ